MAKKKTSKTAQNKPATKKKPGAKKPASSKRGLGRGLSALMDDVSMDNFVSDDVVIVDDIMDMPTPMEDARSDVNDDRASTHQITRDDEPLTSKDGVTFVSMGQLERNPEQPRRHFDPVLLDELATSVKQKGILQPILVRALPERRRNKVAYQIVAGERRWQAAMKAGLDSMPVFVREISDQEALEIGVIENVQRAELNPVEEAMAYKALISQFGRTQEDVANAVGKSRSYVANMMRLLSLPEKVQTFLAEGKISTGHARAIIAAPDPAELADVIVKNDLSVRDAENWARKLKTQDGVTTRSEKAMKAADEKRLEAELMDALGLAIDLRHKGPGGELRIKYKSGDQLEEVMKRLKNG